MSENSEKFLIFLGIASFLILIISLILKTLITYQQIYFVRMREVSISKRLIESYLNQKYSWFLSRNTSEIGKTILSEVGLVIGNALIQQ